MLKETLFAAMVSLLSQEMPDINEPVRAERKHHIELLAEDDVREGSLGLIVSEEFDPLILAAAQFGESRFNIDAIGKAGEIGAMQLAPTAHTLRWDIIAPGREIKFTESSVKAHDSNTLMGYYLLEYRTEACKTGGNLYRMFSAYRRSGCPKRGQFDYHAKERCKALVELAKQTGVAWPAGVTCEKD